MRLDIGEEPVAVKFDGFDGAILGFGSQYGSFECLVYDRQKCIEILVDRDGMDYDEALEFFEFNVACLYAGPGTPIFIEPMTDMDELDEALGR
jgi:hypothetical protein